MAGNRGNVNNLKPFVKGDPRINRAGNRNGLHFQQVLEKALTYKTPQKLRAQILKSTGQEVITYEQAVLAVLVAKAATGSARHIEILYKLRGDFARAEAEAKKEVGEANDGTGETGSTLLIKVVRRSESPIDSAVDVTPQGEADAITG